MNRHEFHRLFKSPGPAVLPVIHVQDIDQIKRNIRICIREGAQGVFLINHDFAVKLFLPMIRATREAFPDLWLGVNFLAVTGLHAFPELSRLTAEGCAIDAYWADDARINEHSKGPQPEAEAINQARGHWQGLYFGGTAFKKQRPVDENDYETAARLATDQMEIVTTSGIATGKAIDASKTDSFRRGCGDHALALASGVTPENAANYCESVDAFLVATGVSAADDFYNLDASLLAKLLATTREAGSHARTVGNT